MRILDVIVPEAECHISAEEFTTLQHNFSALQVWQRSLSHDRVLHQAVA